jgi:hypothetical protein
MHVIESDITHGLEHDFRFAKCPDECDIIVTNPPYSLTVPFMERCIEIGKPWALLLPLQKLDTKKVRPLMEQSGASLYIVNGKPKWIRPDGTTVSFGFSFGWYTAGIFEPRSLRFMVD